MELISVGSTDKQPLRLREQSTAAELRDDTRRRSIQSLHFFLGSVLKVPGVSEELAEELQRLGLRRLTMLVAGALLWCRLHRAKPTADPAKHEAVRWLFPEVKEL